MGYSAQKLFPIYLGALAGLLRTTRLWFQHSIQTTSIELLDPENIGVAVGISFLSHLQAENTPALVTYVAKKA